MGSLIPGYEYDIFISYRQKDNKSGRQGTSVPGTTQFREAGWVSEFVTALKTELETTLKDEVSIYFDENPRDGLLETHDVDASLREKLRCLIFMPVVSKTYCDSRSYAWKHELAAFVEEASKDRFGLRIKLPNGNVASRVLPVRIHDLDDTDLRMFEEILGGMLRSIDFIFSSPGVNRPLRINEDHPHDNRNKTYYRDQINKTANAIDDIIRSLQSLSAGVLPVPDEASPAVLTDEEIITPPQPFPAGNIRQAKPFGAFTMQGTPENKFKGKYRLPNLKKIIYTILILAPILALVFGWNDITRLMGPGSAKREQAAIHATNARILCDKGELEASKREAAIALDIDPENSSAWTTLAAVSFKEGDKSEAIQLTLEALKADPENSTAAYNLALSFDDTEDYIQAAEWYSKAIKIDSSKVPAYSALGRLYNRLNRTADAVLILSLAEKKYPDSEYLYLVFKNLGNSFLLMNQPDSAIRYLQKSYTAKPDEPETILFLAKAWEASGNIARSIEFWQYYIKAEPDTLKVSSAREHLKEITVKHLKDISR